MKKLIKENWKLFLIVSLTLGLAPFNPPHIWGKIQWILGGGAIGGDNPMQLMDWGDFFMHGSPWFLLIISGLLNLLSKSNS